MANTIATPLEKQFTQIPGLTLSTSSSTQGSTNITLQFDLRKSIDAAATDVQSAIQRATGQLPNDLPSPPTFVKTNPNDQPVMYIALTSDTLTRRRSLQIRHHRRSSSASTFCPAFRRSRFTASRAPSGSRPIPARWPRAIMTLDDLATAIRAGTSYSGAGQFDGKNAVVCLAPERADRRLPKATAISSIARGKDNAPVYLRDVANVIDGVQDERLSRHFFARGFNPPASTIVLAVSRQAGANAVEVAQIGQRSAAAAATRAARLDQSDPDLRSLADASCIRSPTCRRRSSSPSCWSSWSSSFSSAAPRDTLIPVVALPLSLLITFLVMWVLNYSINNLTLMALTLAIGFLVDDAIVFLENVVRRAEHGESIYRATLNSAGEISFTILSMTLSLAAVFIPLVFMPGLARPNLSRVRGHDHRRDFRFRPGFADADAADVRALAAPSAAGPSPRPGWSVSRRFFQPILALLRPLARLVSRSRLARARRSWSPAASASGSSSPRLPFTLLPTGDSGVIRGFLHRAGRRLAAATARNSRTSSIRSCRRIQPSTNTSPSPAADGPDRPAFSPFSS